MTKTNKTFHLDTSLKRIKVSLIENVLREFCQYL